MATETKKLYALIATFTKTPEFFNATGKVRDAGFTKWDCFTPFPVHGLDAQMGMKRSNVPIFTLLGGLLGFSTGTFITWFMNGFDYQLIVGGKPFWSPVFAFPVMYELTILFAAFGTLFGMFATNMLPRHNHPVFEYKDFFKSSDDTFMLMIERSDPKFNDAKTIAFLKEIGAEEVHPIEA